MTAVPTTASDPWMSSDPWKHKPQDSLSTGRQETRPTGIVKKLQFSPTSSPPLASLLTAVATQQNTPTVPKVSIAERFLKDMQEIRDRHAKSTGDVKELRAHTVREDCASRSIGIGTDLQIGKDISLTINTVVQDTSSCPETRHEGFEVPELWEINEQVESTAGQVEVTRGMSETEDDIGDVFGVDAIDEEDDTDDRDPSSYRSDPKKLQEYGLEMITQSQRQCRSRRPSAARGRRDVPRRSSGTGS